VDRNVIKSFRERLFPGRIVVVALPRDRLDWFGLPDRGADFIPVALIARNTSNGAACSEFQKCAPKRGNHASAL